MSASLSGLFNFQAFSDAGLPLVGGRLYTYAAGTTTHKVAYTDAAATVPQTYVSDGLGGLYIALNARGELPAPLFLTAGGYDIALKTAAGVTVWTRRASGLDDAATTLVDGLRVDLANTSDATKGDALIGVKQPITNSVARTQHAKNAETVSIADFGVVPDGGVADQSARLQVAINAAIAGKFRLHAPAGRYLFTSPIIASIPSSEAELFWLSGDLTGTTFLFDDTGDFITLRAAIGYLDMGPRVRISNITFETPGAVPTSLIRNELAINVELDHLHFAGTSVSVAHIINEKAYGLELSYSVFRQTTGDGVRLKAAPLDAEHSYVVGIKKCDFSTVDGNGLYIEGSANLLVQHTIFQQVKLNGVLFDSAVDSSLSFNAVFDSCWFEQNVAADISAPSNASYWAEFTLRNCQFGYRAAVWKGAALLPALIELGARSRVTILGTTVFGGPVCNITGSAGAAATLFDAVGFVQVGTFAWASFGRTEARAVSFTSENGTKTAVANNTATTFKFMPIDASSYNQCHLVTASISSGAPGAYSAVALITSSGLAWRLTALQTSTNLALSMGAEQLQVTQTSGAAADVMWTLTRIS